MKTKYFIGALIGILSLGQIKAADLYVRDLGAGGAFPTISAAITAANDGDRIIIRPKTGNVPYLENLTINKSLTFASEINFSKYYVQGTISIVPAVNRVVTINNMHAFQSRISTSNVTLSGGRATVNIINCIVDLDIDLATQKVTANIHGNTSKNIKIVHGKITGNNCNNVSIASDSAPLATSEVYVIGNKSGQINPNSSYPINILNNDIKYDVLPIWISDLKPGSTNTIQNNRVETLSSMTAPISVSTNGNNTSAILVITNNILIGNTNADKITINPNQPLITAIANYNLSSNGFITSGVDIESNNISNATYSLDLTNLTSSGAIINAGVPDEEYQDLDLTRNDIGPLGGSNSWVNYWPANAGDKPRVSFLHTPRRVYQGTTTLQAEATVISK